MNLPISPPHPVWTDALALEVALALQSGRGDMAPVLENYDLDADAFLAISKDKLFQQRVRKYQDDLKDGGYAFKLKAQAQAEILLDTSWRLIHSAEVAASVKADLIKQTVRWAGLDTVKDDESGQASGGVRININIAGSASTLSADARVIDHE